MTYDEFTLRKIKQDFQLTVIEGERFLPKTEPVASSAMLQEYLENYLPWAIAVGSGKAKPETIVAPVLLELKRLIDEPISVFSGRDFTVDAALGLSGICDFLISRSAEQLEFEAPVAVLVQASFKRAFLTALWNRSLAIRSDRPTHSPHILTSQPISQSKRVSRSPP